jgi:glucosamine-6-phosphate deaminase
VMRDSFMNCFGSQRAASFPSWEYDGPFCDLAQRQWVRQYQMVLNCLGERFFIENEHPQLRATRGFVFVKSMSLDEFSGHARRLARLTEGESRVRPHL